MKLKDYLEESQETFTAFAERADLTLSTVQRAAMGKVVPSPATMKAIHLATDGAVTPNDFFDGLGTEVGAA